MGASTSTERGARVSFPPPLVFVAGIGLGVACRYLIAPARAPIDSTLRLLAGLATVTIGVAFMGSARILFVRAGQSPAPWKPTPRLFFEGPYRFTRNPMYVGATTAVLGLGVTLNNLWISFFALPALGIVHFMAVLPEERYLSEKFSDSYAQYLGKVRRYL
jgi:protein-S-isoprenylcysteine O-methyltransferase Ste14